MAAKVPDNGVERLQEEVLRHTEETLQWLASMLK